MKIIFWTLSLLVISTACQKTEHLETLSTYIVNNDSLTQDELIACAGGRFTGLGENEAYPTSVFFYPVSGAYDFKYFEANDLKDSLDFSKYIEKPLTDDPVFNGYLWRFNNTYFDGERMGVVTYKTPGKLHVCTPIRLKTNPKPTEVNADLVTLKTNPAPSFHWQDGKIKENVIYFQVISDADGHLVSGTYTLEPHFTFYDLNNVVLNITDTSITPTLKSQAEYTFTLMGVSEDNWVNLMAVKSFIAP